MEKNLQEITIDSASLKLFGKLYLIDKEKPTIILLHGLGFNTFEYDDLAPLLNKGGYNCLSFDFRSCGQSEGKRGYWTLADYIEDTKNAIEYVKNNINDNIVLYGNSLGAVVAIAVSAKYNQDKKIKAIISANCATKIADFALNPSRRFLIVICSGVFKIFHFRVSVNYFIPYTLIIKDKKIIENIKRDKTITEARKFAISTYLDMFSWDMTKLVPNINAPILILQGKEDRLQPRKQATMLFDAAVEPKEMIFTETEHVPNLENPKYISELVIKWLNKKVNSA